MGEGSRNLAGGTQGDVLAGFGNENVDAEDGGDVGAGDAFAGDGGVESAEDTVSITLAGRNCPMGKQKIALK